MSDLKIKACVPCPWAGKMTMRKINLNLRGKLLIVVICVVVIFSVMDFFASTIKKRTCRANEPLGQ